MIKISRSALLLALSVLLIQDASAQKVKQSTVKRSRASVIEAFIGDRVAHDQLESLAATPCTGGTAGTYPCKDIDLLAFMPLSTIGGGEGNDIWGWTDSTTGKEYALMGRSNGTAFVDISDPENPIYLGNLPTHSSSNSWRDIKVYSDHAFIVADFVGNHGMQVFDLTQLRSVPSPPVTFSNTAHFSGFGSAHNIVINEDSGFAYGVGASTCGGGLHMIDISTPTNPVDVGCFSSDGYTHDAQCVIYTGPDSDHTGKEICLNSNEDTITLVDVTDKSNPIQLSRAGYPSSSYTHQGWLSEDQRYFFVNDEQDEGPNNTRTYVWDVDDLDDPVLINTHVATTPAIDHNLYVKDDLMYQANYRAGLRILDTSNPAVLEEIAFFDIYPANDNRSFNGAWSTYPYFDSGVVVVSGIEQGLFILQPQIERLRISKTASTPTVPNGGTLTYTLTVLNDTPNQLNNVVTTDDLPANTSYVAGSASDGGSESGGRVNFPAVSLNPGEQIVRTFMVTVSVPGGGPQVYFSDDNESGTSQWTTSGTGSSNWSTVNTNPYSGSTSWFADNVGSVSDQQLNTVSFTPSGGVELAVWHSYATESGWDGGVIEVSSDGGSSWSDLGSDITSNGYNETIGSGYDNPLSGRSAFSGSSGGYIETLVDLSSYSGQSIQIRFRLGTDNTVTADGWHVDDILVSSGSVKIDNLACVNATGQDEACASVSTPVVTGPSVTATAKVWLSGAYDPAQDEMATGQNSLVPLTQPYSAASFDGTSRDYDGTESATSINAEVVDWVIVELRSGLTAASTVSRQAALLLEDGQVVGSDYGNLSFDAIASGQYFLVIRHRNHVSIMSSSSALLDQSVTANFNLTSNTSVYGTNALREMEAGVFGMWSSDGNIDDTVSAFDFINVFLPQNGQGGYMQGDFNLSGTVSAFDFSQSYLLSTGFSSQVPN